MQNKKTLYNEVLSFQVRIEKSASIPVTTRAMPSSGCKGTRCDLGTLALAWSEQKKALGPQVGCKTRGGELGLKVTTERESMLHPSRRRSP